MTAWCLQTSSCIQTSALSPHRCLVASCQARTLTQFGTPNFASATLSTDVYNFAIRRTSLPLATNTIMATELTVQSERAYQKQPHIFTNQKRSVTKTRRAGKGGRRWFKDVGLGFRTPKTAIEGSYIGTRDTLASILVARDSGWA